MSGRGRARPPSRNAQESAAGPSRRSTRHQQQQQQQQNAAPAQADEAQLKTDDVHGQQQEQQEEQGQQQQPQQDEAVTQQVQAEAAVVVPVFDQNIDPAITGAQPGSMPPPPVPSAKGARGQAPIQPARRGTRRSDDVSSSINSVAPTDVFSNPEPPSASLPVGTPGRLLATPGRAASVVSNVTDTPAKKKARANLISRNLTRLFTAAEDLFNVLGSPQEELEAWEDERTFYKKLLDVVRSSFVASASDLVVVPSFVTEAMGVDQNSPLFYKALRIVTATNLATLLNDITPVNAQSLLPLLQVLDKAFFECFVADIPITAENQIYEQILEQAIMIRTQLSIQTLKKLRTDSPVSFSPHAELAKIWCEGEPSVDAIKLFLANNPDAVQIRPIEPDTPSAARADEWDRASTRFRALCGLVPGDVINGYNLDLTQLEEEFSLDGFIASLRAWTNQTFARIKRQLLESEAAPSDADSQIRSQLETESLMHGYNREASSPITYDMNALRMMKQLESNATPNYGNPQLAASSYNPPPRVPYPPDFTTGFDYSDPSQHGFQSSGALYAASAAQIAAGKKRKDGAPADDGAPGSSAPPAKKPRARRNRNIAPVADMTALVSEPSNNAIPSETAPTESQYPPLLGPQDEPDFEALTKKSREISAANRKAKEPQVRSPWVQKDVRLLVKAVDTYRCKWSQIEKAIKEGIIPFERPRDQQALRDKARLLKQDLLKVDAVLPRGFDGVVLGKKEREAVMALGKNPDRKEADLDERGRPINTEWRGQNEQPARAPPATDASVPPAPVPSVEAAAQAEVQPEAPATVPEQAVA